MKRLLASALVFGLFVSLVSSAQADDEKTKKKPAAKKTEAKATHKQVRSIKPSYDGKPIVLNTFCLDADGNILACVGGKARLVAKGSKEQPTLVQKYSPKGDLLAEYKVNFKPTAINAAKDGSVFVAGEGRIIRLDRNGKVVASADSPNIGDMDEFKKKVEEAAKKQMEQMAKTFRKQLDLAHARIEKIEETEEDDRTAAQKAQLKSNRQMVEIYERQIKMFEDSETGFYSPKNMLKQKLTINSLAVGDKDVFVTTGSMEGRGYAVWRVDYDLSNAKQVMDSLSGCCGQLDIQATGDKLLIAENSRFRVRVCDRDGKELNKFGSRDRKAVDGFGSCCNPMNVRCCSNGDILTAESSIGNIKRFSADGEFKGFVGKAKVGGGCKHVAIGFDEKRNYYYMMHEDKSHICVLVPLSEAPEFTEDEIAAKQAREGLGRKLIGKWALKKTKKQQAPAKDDVSVLIGFPTAKAYEFTKSGELTMKGGMFSALQNNNEEIEAAMPELGWEAVCQKGQVLTVAQLMDGVANYEMRIEFVSGNEIKVSTTISGQVLGSPATYVREDS